MSMDWHLALPSVELNKQHDAAVNVTGCKPLIGARYRKYLLGSNVLPIYIVLNETEAMT